MVSLSDIKSRAKKAVSTDGNDNSRIDQEQARVERARQEAQREAERERVRERVEQAREEAGQQDTDEQGTLNRAAEVIQTATEQVSERADGGSVIEDIDQAMGTDFDNDGEPLAAEFGFQTNDRADVENDALGTLGDRVSQNERNISSLESEVFGSPSQRSSNQQDPMSPGFGGTGSEKNTLRQMGIDPEDGL
jgi:hypothetical protein